jgi:predicted DsbA family dithiol-disulfide isomerase
MAGEVSAGDATAGPATARLMIEVWSDIVCPWCYIGKRRLERALAVVAGDPAFGVEVEVDVVYRPFQLDPTAPLGRSEPVADAYARKFGGVERARAMIEHVTRIAAEEGLEFRLDRARRANTADAHRLLWWALRDHGAVVQAALKERLMAAYFTEGADVGDLEVLARCAGDVGLDAGVARRRLDGEEGVESLAVGLQRADDLGITAVPTYVLAGTWSVPGAQDAETFAALVRRAAKVLAGGAGR